MSLVGQTEWGRVVHAFVEGVLFGPGVALCGRRTQVIVPADTDASRCPGCFPPASTDERAR